MLLTMKDGTGRTIDAFLLAASPNNMRLAVRDSSDALELIYTYGEWRTEDGLPIEIEFIQTDGRLGQEFFERCTSRVRTASGN